MVGIGASKKPEIIGIPAVINQTEKVKVDQGNQDMQLPLPTRRSSIRHHGSQQTNSPVIQYLIMPGVTNDKLVSGVGSSAITAYLRPLAGFRGNWDLETIITDRSESRQLERIIVNLDL